MTKAELIEVMAEKANTSKAAAKRALDSFSEAVTDALKKGEKVTLVGFGTFTVAERKARKGRNPQTGKAMQIPGGKSPKFKAGKSLKDRVATKKK
ncbi:MAG: HU family DNA-binding protein [Deltaproteobacteria bacterium]|nr:HU family DNA-binding protein [Deltaproteobacteria bacterium]